MQVKQMAEGKINMSICMCICMYINIHTEKGKRREYREKGRACSNYKVKAVECYVNNR